MKQIKGTLAHPGYSEVPICGGTKTARIDKWTLAQRAELKPRLARLIETAVGSDAALRLDLGAIFGTAEEEITEICKVCAKLPQDLKFEELYWEDIPTLAQAIWETNIITEEGGGIGGKLANLFAPLLAQVLQTGQLRAMAAAVSRSQVKTQPEPKQPDLPSLPDAGEPTPTSSATP